MDAQHTERNVVAAALHNLRVQITLKALRTDVEITISNELVCSNQDIVPLAWFGVVVGVGLEVGLGLGLGLVTEV